ncbi:GNAT family N-acetyltransferase [Flavisolibacter nicotianae]|uniref:GNAT family N-acetyltransferase n=1 Tax=Flavisolibacter nicotianae TaxID=2364882 RepID=UPI000EB2C1CF|nr:GNAT family N-acetyltransferase [Flavisolibacter nicotianae]
MFPFLSTERLLLQSIEPDDQPFIFEGLSHPEVIPFYGVRYSTFEESKRQMDWYATIYKEQTGVAWKIVDKQSGCKMGVIAYYFFKPEHRKAEIGFWLLPQYWNKGLISEALIPVVAYCKDEIGIHRLEAFVEEGNSASSRVLEKAGFAFEGKMKDCEIKGDRYISLLIYALLPA